MRLIDADALEPYYRLMQDNATGMKMMALPDGVVDQQPIVDAVPVRHGKWKKSGHWGRCYKCDQCGNYLDFDGVNSGRGSANYCPNCGARMDTERKEE